MLNQRYLNFKKLLKTYIIDNIYHSFEIYRAKKLFLNDILQRLDIFNVTKVQKSGQGFCDTYIVEAEKSVVIKRHNPKRYSYFKEDFKSIEPIYEFLDYSERFNHEKEQFEKLNNKEVKIINDMIIFPLLRAKPLSNYLYEKSFYHYLGQAIEILQNNQVRHGDFHIENILVGDRVFLIDFEMVFSDFLSHYEQFYYDIYYFFAKLEYQYPQYFISHFKELRLFVEEKFSEKERKFIVDISRKTERYFSSVNKANHDLFI
jgi:hypothetical protein